MVVLGLSVLLRIRLISPIALGDYQDEGWWRRSCARALLPPHTFTPEQSRLDLGHSVPPHHTKGPRFLCYKQDALCRYILQPVLNLERPSTDTNLTFAHSTEPECSICLTGIQTRT
jgi:hypothetical protein